MKKISLCFLNKSNICFLFLLILVSCTNRLNGNEVVEQTAQPTNPIPASATPSTKTIQPSIEQPELTLTESICPPGPLGVGDSAVDDPETYIGHFFKEGQREGLDGKYHFYADDDKHYRITEVWNGNVRMMWLEMHICQDASGEQILQVKDVIIFPALDEDELVSTQCTINSNGIRNVIVLGEVQPDVREFTRVLYAWRTNLLIEKFIPISTEGVNCIINWGQPIP